MKNMRTHESPRPHTTTTQPNPTPPHHTLRCPTISPTHGGQPNLQPVVSGQGQGNINPSFINHVGNIFGVHGLGGRINGAINSGDLNPLFNTHSGISGK